MTKIGKTIPLILLVFIVKHTPATKGARGCGSHQVVINAKIKLNKIQLHNKQTKNNRVGSIQEFCEKYPQKHNNWSKISTET